MRLRLTAAALDWFESNNISFHNRFGIRLRPGEHVNFADGQRVEPYIGIHAGNTFCSMGFMSYTNSSVNSDLRVGRYCSIAPGLKLPKYRHPMEHISTSIFTHDRGTDLVVRFVRDNKASYSNFFSNPQKGPVNIGHDVWIGQDVSLMPGITIGTGSIIAANSVVTKSVMPYEIVGGNPAKLIKMRFPPRTIIHLLLSEWWRYKFTDFSGLDISNPDAFLKAFEERRGSIEPYNPSLISLSEVAPHCQQE